MKLAKQRYPVEAAVHRLVRKVRGKDDLWTGALYHWTKRRRAFAAMVNGRKP